MDGWFDQYSMGHAATHPPTGSREYGNTVLRMISIYGEQGRLEHIDILLSFFTPCPRTRLYDTAIRHGLARLTTLEEWGDFDQFDFKAPWMPQELYDLVLELRAGMP